MERHGETIRVRDTVLLKSGPRKTSTPYVAKISALWENPESGTPCLESSWALVSRVLSRVCLPLSQRLSVAQGDSLGLGLDQLINLSGYQGLGTHHPASPVSAFFSFLHT